MRHLNPKNQQALSPEENCPVCKTARKKEFDHCEICAWYFPIVKSSQYLLELNQAKQQYKMISTLDQVFSHMENQNKMMKKMKDNILWLEKELVDMQKKQK